MEVNNPFSLIGKTILVTGASSGIGRSTALECSKMGANIILTGRDEERLKETYFKLQNINGSNKMILADLCNNDQLDYLSSAVENLDGIVLSAGTSILMPLKFTNKEKFYDIFNINFFSQSELVRQLIKKKKINKKASIVFISSVGGNTVFATGNAMYGSSKAALSAYMKFCVRECSSNNLRFNTINPGRIDTPLIENDNITDKVADIETYPLKRYGSPEEVAYAAIYLLSEAASWVTGISLNIDGGLSIK